jgi:hypothetical protein
MGANPNPIRWLRDLTPAAWLPGRLDRSFGRLGSLVPDGYEAYARLAHPVTGGASDVLSLAERSALVDILRGETKTASRCWFCVEDRHRELDDQGVSERLHLPGGDSTYLLHGGPLERALLPPPEKPLRLRLRDDASPEELARDLADQLSAHRARGFSIASSGPPEEIKELARSMNADPAFLKEVSPTLWWPEDRSWFVVTAPPDIGSTFVAGSRRLVDRLLASPALQAQEAHLDGGLGELARDLQERTYGPVIASGTEAGQSWTLRGRIAEDGVWSMFESAFGGGGGGGGVLPFADLGWKKLGHFGSLGWSSGHAAAAGRAPVSSLKGVISKQVSTIEVHLADGATLPARIIDTGDPRASFFVAVWSGPFAWTTLVARDVSGREIEIHPRG